MGFNIGIPYVTEPIGMDPGYSTPQNYQIQIWSNKFPVALKGNLPESFQIGLGATWNQPFNKSFADLMGQNTQKKLANSKIGGLASKFDTNAIDAVSKATGFSTLSKWLSVSVWIEGTNMSLTLPMTFKAYNDPVADVTDKIVQLMSMTAPSTLAGGFLQAPGPTIKGVVSQDAFGSSFDGEVITVQMGNFMRLCPVIITDVSTEIDCRFDAAGNAMSATVNVTIATPLVTTREDVISIFLRNNIAAKLVADAPAP